MMKQRPSRQQVIQTASVPAPVGGLNARDSIAAMPPTDALVMNNWFPTPSGIDVRGGSQDWATGITGTVETLMAYNGPTGSKLFAVANSMHFYEVTAQAAAVLQTVNLITTARFSYVNFGTAGGQFMIAVNGNDRASIYDGTNWNPYGTGGSQALGALTYNTGPQTVTAQTAGASPHNLYTGNTVIISGATPAGYNGTFVVTVVNATTFTYPLISNPGTATAAGNFALPYAITGVNSTSLIYVTAFKSRLYFVQRDTLRCWYLPVQQIAGTAVLFDLSSIFKLGGKLVAMQSWNIDTVAGPNDYFAFLTDKGEVAVYQGYDPSQSGTWSLVGLFRIGRPASGNRFLTKVGSDLYVVTVDGIVPLSKAMLTDRSQGNFQVSAKIDNILNNDVANYASNFGWQIVLFPVGNKIIVNVPQVEDTVTYQYVCNTITGAWTIFSGWLSPCYEIMGDKLFFGTSGKVVQADVGNADNNVAIVTDLKPAFSAFDAPAQNKQFTMARPVFSSSGDIGISSILNVDFRDVQPTAALNLPASANASFWNVALWNVSFWSQSGVININWQSVAGIGFQASYRIKTISKTQCTLLAIDYGYQPGGIY